jgi:hypothetical protein
MSAAVSILGLAALAPAPGQTRVGVIGDEADKNLKRLPRVDRMALQVAKLALGAHPVEGLGLIVGTGYGGLQATVDFLEGIAVRNAGFGSPTAFHQSVHHSPAGQISLALKITGPSLTCTSREVSSEAALREGIDLLTMHRCAKILVVCSDEVVPALEAAFRAMGAPWTPSEGAAAVLLALGEGELQVGPVKLSSKSASMLAWTKAPPPGANVNPSAGMINLVAAARALEPGQSVTLQSYSLGGGEATVALKRR